MDRAGSEFRDMFTTSDITWVVDEARFAQVTSGLHLAQLLQDGEDGVRGASDPLERRGIRARAHGLLSARPPARLTLISMLVIDPASGAHLAGIDAAIAPGLSWGPSFGVCPLRSPDATARLHRHAVRLDIDFEPPDVATFAETIRHARRPAGGPGGVIYEAWLALGGSASDLYKRRVIWGTASLIHSIPS